MTKAVLFDLDGTILDTRSNIVSALVDAIKDELGITINPDEAHQRDMLRRRPKEYFAQHYGGRAAKLYDYYRARYSSDGINQFENILEVIVELKKRGLLVGIVTNKARERVMQDFAYIGFDRIVFDIVITAEDTVERKPHPAPLLCAAHALSVDPTECFYVGDGPHDVIVANAAGAASVAAAWGYYTSVDLQACGPTFLADSVSAFEEFIYSEEFPKEDMQTPNQEART